jgi:RHH-type proline utilization regulon transcriptional repressor/proline dehydrogenase/delta 1-pyrroline-5-carboxylate dehydrogenase
VQQRLVPAARSASATSSATPCARRPRRQSACAHATVDRRVAPAPSEAEILAVGKDLAAALPPASRNPVKQLDEKAMDMASQDAELRAALFRFVDVVPACRNLDDLARHLSGFLAEVDDRPARWRPRCACRTRARPRRARRRRGGRRQAHGPPLHRRRDHARRRGHHESLWNDGVGTTVDLLGEATVTSAEADRYAARCRESLDGLAEVYRGLPERPILERDSAGPIPRANLSVKVSALTPLLRPTRPSWASATPPGACASCCATPRSSARTCTSTWSPTTPARPSPTSCSRC